MTLFNCFPSFSGKKKRDKEALKLLCSRNNQNMLAFEDLGTHRDRQLSPTSLGISKVSNVEEHLICNMKVVGHEKPHISGEVVEVAYEGEDEREGSMLMKKVFSDGDLSPHISKSSGEYEQKMRFSCSFDDKKDAEECAEIMESGHISDPGVGKAEFWTSPKLKRSCSDLERRDVHIKVVSHLPSPQCPSHLQDPGSPSSLMSYRSADKVLLKKHSSSQILPSRSRSLWWKLFLWSHRNLHNHPSTPSESLTLPAKAAMNQKGGYGSDTLEPNRSMDLSKGSSPGSFTGDSMNPGQNPSWNSMDARFPGLWPQNQWLAFSIESPSLNRVDEWVSTTGSQPLLSVEEDNQEAYIVYPPSPESGKPPAGSSTQLSRHPNTNISEDISHANNIIQSLNSSTTVAHIAGIGLKVVPTISRFSCLRSVNLSNNSIVHIPSGSLPKGLHKLDLSRNKITTIEGLRELTRLRTLDLSHNRISRIGQGLSNCQRIKELYLAGNKISAIEGLHRLLKLTVLDLSFNKITTTKALGQLVANYNSLLALNLLGNSIITSVNEDQLRKTVRGLLPNLAYLNKQPLKPQRAGEIINDSVAKAALGTGSRCSRRRTAKRASQGGSTPPGMHRSSLSSKHKLRKKNSTHSRLSATASCSR